MDPHPPKPAGDRVEELLAEVVALPETDQRAGLEDLCNEHVDLADRLRARFALYLGMRDTKDRDPGEAPRAFGEFALERELGHGGMGVVYLARQRRGDQERLVALKLVRDRGLFSPQARERLRREGAAAFRMDHPGICPVLDVGEVEGTPYVAMRYVPGQTLAERIAAARQVGAPLELPADTVFDDAAPDSSAGTGQERIRAVAALGEHVARALHAAHEAGLIHRDVKPGNVMVTPEGLPVLLDFGLVRDESQEEASLTLTGQPLGTPAYMSPEQISPKARPIDRTTDVYSLGATLFEAIALRPPFEGRTREELYRRVLSDDPPRLRSLAPWVSRDLQIVLETALEKDPSRRYATALAFAEDLRRVRMSQPILARPPGPVRRLSLWVTRNRLASAILALLVVSQVVIVFLARRSERNAEEARLEKASALTHFQWARDAVGELTRTATDHLMDVPWMEGVRTELFEKADAFHSRFLAERGEDPELRLDASVARRESAALRGQMGRYVEAEGLLSRAKRDLELVPGAGLDLARTHYVSALVAEMRGDLSVAATEFRAAAAGWHAELEDRPDAGDVRADLGQCLRRLADLLFDRGELSEAGEAVERALAVLEAGGEDERLDLQRAGSFGQRAKIRREARDFEKANTDYERADQLLREWLRRKPHDRRALMLAGSNKIGHGRLLRQVGKPEEARAAYEEARDRSSAVVHAFPDMVAPKVNLATSLNNLSTLARQRGDGEAAAVLMEESVSVLEDLVRDHGAPAFKSRLAIGRYNLANSLRTRDPAESERQYRLAQNELDALVRVQPEVPLHRGLASSTAMNLGTLLAISGRDEEAAEQLGRAGSYSRELVSGHPENLRYRRDLGLQLFNEGMHLAEIGNDAKAAERLEESFSVRQKLVELTNQSERSYGDLLKTTVRLGQVADLPTNPNRLATWREAYSAVEEMPASVRAAIEADDVTAFDLACLENGFGAALEDGDSELAVDLLGAARRRLESWMPQDPPSIVVAEYLLCCLALAAVHESAGSETDLAAAVDAAEEAVARLDLAGLGSRLQRRRLALALPALERLLQSRGRSAAVVQDLRQALAGQR